MGFLSSMATASIGSATDIAINKENAQLTREENEKNRDFTEMQNLIDRQREDAYNQTMWSREDQQRAEDFNREDAYNRTMWSREDKQRAEDFARQDNYNDTVWGREDLENAITREREDNSHQREVEDLRKAGLNPLLATGGASAILGATGGGSVIGGAAGAGGGVSGSATGAGGGVSKGAVHQDQIFQNKSIGQTIMSGISAGLGIEQMKADAIQQDIDNANELEKLKETARHNKATEENMNFLNRIGNKLLDKVEERLDGGGKNLDYKNDDSTMPTLTDYITNPKQAWEQAQKVNAENKRKAEQKAKRNKAVNMQGSGGNTYAEQKRKYEESKKKRIIKTEMHNGGKF